MSMKKLGKAFITVDGQRLQTYPGATCQPGGIVRSVKKGHEVHGYSEADEEGMVECEIDIGADTSLRDIEAMSDVTVRFECDTGQVYIGAHWWSEKTPDFTDGSDSKAKVKFVGPKMEEVSANA